MRSDEAIYLEIIALLQELEQREISYVFAVEFSAESDAEDYSAEGHPGYGLHTLIGGEDTHPRINMAAEILERPFFDAGIWDRADYEEEDDDEDSDDPTAP